MDKTNKARGLKATDEGIEKIKSKMATMPKPNNIDKIGWSQQDIADQSCVSVDTVKRFLKGTAIDRDSIIKIASSLGFEPTDLVNKQDWIPSAIDWQNICQKILDKKPLRRNITGNSIELNIFVEVGVNKLIQQQNSNTQEEYYSYDRFFSEVIENNDLGRLAIIGEPGSGKTTLLERIAKFAKTTASIIWIDLQRLGQKTIEEYLRQIWLKSNLDLIDQNLLDPTPELEKELAKLFNSGEVWLILDGVDEMAEKNAIDALDRISENITGWLDKAKIILSCRQNVWAENLNTIKDFQVYQTLNFSYGDLKEDTQDQVKDFINQYFSHDLYFAKKLYKKLNKPKNQRVKELVKNPLSLFLLCLCWKRNQGNLPKTKSGLYRMFVNGYYQWRKSECLINETERQNLHKSLGELAKIAISNNKPMFEFPESVAVKIMGQEYFDLAVKLNWLTFSYLSIELENIYTFLHTSFQEYFASLVIDDWHFFLNNNNSTNSNSLVEFNDNSYIYRIFESKWKEVILLWFSRNDICDDLKNQFVFALQNFNTNHFDIYTGLALKLATEVIDEYENQNLVYEIKEKNAFLHRFGKTVINSTDQLNLSNVEDLAIKALHTNNFQQKITNLISVIEENLAIASNDQELGILFSIVVDLLLKIDPGNPLAIKFLESLLKKVKNIILFYFCAIHFILHSPDKIQAWNRLLEILNEISEEGEEKEFIQKILKISPENPNFLIEQVQLFQEIYGYSDEELNNELQSFFISQDILSDPSLLNKEVFNLLYTTIYSEEPETSFLSLLKLHIALQKNKIYFTLVSNIKKITNGNLVNDNSDTFVICYTILWLCAKNMSYSEFYRAWHSENLQNLDNQYNNLPLLTPTNQGDPLKIDQLILQKETEEI